MYRDAGPGAIAPPAVLAFAGGLRNHRRMSADGTTGHGKLFRAIVVMGAALTADACGDSTTPVDAAVHDGKVADATPRDAGKDAPHADAAADAVVIL